MSRRIRRWLIAGVLAALVGGVVGGFAYARATGGDTINACAKTADGQLRLDTGGGCLASEQAVQWSKTGPQGIQGPAGPSGLSTSIERTFFRRLQDVSTWQEVAQTQADRTHLTSIHLAEGNYVVQTQVIGADFTGTGTLVCITGNNAFGGFAVGQASVGNTGGYVNQTNIAYQSDFAITAGGGDLEVSCWLAPDGDGGHPLVGYADVIATKVDSLG
jgi:hypothetical protein